MTALETGEIDFTWRVPPDQMDGLKKNSELNVETTPSHEYYFIWMNGSREPFTDKRIRQAMIYALDIDTMAKDLLPGIGQRAHRADPANGVRLLRRRRRTPTIRRRRRRCWPRPASRTASRRASSGTPAPARRTASSGRR